MDPQEGILGWKRSGSEGERGKSETLCSTDRWEEQIIFYNCDIPLPHAYLYEKQLFPTGRCIAQSEGGRIFQIHPDPSESVWMDDGDLPDLRVMELRAMTQRGSGQVFLPGRKVRYVIKGSRSKDKTERVRPFPLVDPDDNYDVKKYLEMLVKATEEVLIHFGHDAKHLIKMLDTSLSFGNRVKYPLITQESACTFDENSGFHSKSADR